MPQNPLGIPVMAQELDRWCWAAVASGVSAALSDQPLAPCRIASALFGSDCCGKPVQCNKVATLQAALGVVSVACVLRTVQGQGASPVDFVEIVVHVRDKARPVGARIADRQTAAGHFVLIVGCDASAGTVLVADPWGTPGFAAPIYRMPYLDLLHRYGGWGTCTHLLFIE